MGLTPRQLIASLPIGLLFTCVAMSTDIQLKSNPDDRTIIKISTRQEIKKFIDSDIDLKEIQQLYLLDLNKENSTEIINYLFINAQSFLKLRKLNIKNTLLDNNNTENLVTILKNAKKLKELRLESNQLNGEGLSKLKDLNRKLKITKLEIIDNPVNLDNLKHLLSKINNVIFLSIRDCQLDDINQKSPRKEIVNLFNKLTYLDLSNTQISNGILTYFLSNTSQLKHLNLSGNDFSSIMAGNTDFLRKSLKSLEVLIVSKGNLGAGALYSLTNLIEENTSLKTLDLNENQIGNEGLHHIARLSGKLKNLQKLTLRFNEFDCKGLVYLAQQNHKIFSQLELLDLSLNRLTGGVEKIADIIQLYPSLKHLNISKSWLTDNDMKSMADRFDVYGMLHVLNLEYNNFTLDGLRHIASKEISKSNLKTISLNSDKIDKINLEEFVIIMSGNINGCKFIF